jgi:hypothetical protein
MDTERRENGQPSQTDGDQRSSGVVVDLAALQAQAESLYLHRFVEAVRGARNEHGRFLVLRSGDEIAIRSAADGSAEFLSEVIVEDLPD